MFNEQKLDKMLTTPSARLIEDVKKIKGDVIILGAGGKMGPSLAILAKRAFESAGMNNRVIAVSRFSDPIAVKLLESNNIEIIPCDLMKKGALDTLPDCENVIFMAGRKFGTGTDSAKTWAMNAWLPSLTAERYKNSNIVVFSSGNIYPIVKLSGGGATENTPVGPIGEYTQSVLAREKVFEYASVEYGTRVLIYRLNYAVDLRYGVLFDIASKVYAGEPVSLSATCFNCIWQGDANEAAIRSLLYASSPISYLNITGPETLSVRATALEFGKLFDKEVTFTGEESDSAYISNASLATKLFGYPTYSAKQLIEWQAEWIKSGNRTLNKPTHFEERKGQY